MFSFQYKKNVVTFCYLADEHCAATSGFTQSHKNVSLSLTTIFKSSVTEFFYTSFGLNLKKIKK